MVWWSQETEEGSVRPRWAVLFALLLRWCLRLCVRRSCSRLGEDSDRKRRPHHSEPHRGRFWNVPVHSGEQTRAHLLQRRAQGRG